MSESIAARYHVVLRDTNGSQKALFDQFVSLHVEKRVNDVGSYTITFYDNEDDRLDFFTLDSIVEVYRSVPASGLDWYLEFVGFHRSLSIKINEDGSREFESSGVDYNDLLRRSTIAYKAGTIRADKDIDCETAIKEYVEENCGPTADDTVVGRLYVGGFPNFTVEDSTGYGETWTGSKAYENLLDTIKDIALFGDIDYAVVPSGNHNEKFIFKTYPEQLGANRTTVGLVPSTGLNSYGFAPVIFSVDFGNVGNISYEYDRSKEANVCLVPGKGDGSTRTVVVVTSPTLIDDSPYNRLEINRPGGSYDDDFETFNLTTAGREALNEAAPKHIIEFTPLQQPTSLYGLHYFLGDKIVVSFRNVDYFKKVVAVTIDFKENKESLSIEFSDVTYMVK